MVLASTALPVRVASTAITRQLTKQLAFNPFQAFPRDGQKRVNKSTQPLLLGTAVEIVYHKVTQLVIGRRESCKIVARKQAN